MKIKVVGSTVDDCAGRFFAASYVINDKIAVDAGSIGFLSSIEEQKRIRSVLLTHPHFDHIASLPIFLDNIYEFGPECPTIYANQQVIDSLLNHVFNDCVWPDLARLSREESPFLHFHAIRSGVSLSLGEVTATPVELSHCSPTFGYIIEDAAVAIAIVSDTSPTEEIWAVARRKANLRAVFIESAFPESKRWLADKAAHLTPRLLLEEYKKLGRDVPLYVMHIKPAFHEETVQQLRALGLPHLEICIPNRSYQFA